MTSSAENGSVNAYMAYIAANDMGSNRFGSVDSSSDDIGGNGAYDGIDSPASTLACLLRYGQSNNVSERQVAVRHLVKTLRSLETGETESIEQVFALIQERFLDDTDPLIRAELVEQLPMMCMTCQQTPILYPKVESTLVPMLAKFLDDVNAQVRKTCQAAIAILIEQELLSSESLHGLICPALLALADANEGKTDEVRLEAISLLCKIVTSSSVSYDWAYYVFLGRFTTFLQDPVLHIRKVCASNLGELARVFGQSIAEQLIVPHLLQLSQDTVWGVRKACAETYTDVSNHCSMHVRRHKLAPRFIQLLSDQSRWVSSQAFQTLGPFIATFANSCQTGLAIRDGALTYEEPTGDEQSLQSTSSSSDDRNRRDNQIQDCRLPPGATVPPQRGDFVDDESADTIELAQQRDDDIMSELKGLLDEWSSSTVGDATSAAASISIDMNHIDEDDDDELYKTDALATMPDGGRFEFTSMQLHLNLYDDDDEEKGDDDSRSLTNKCTQVELTKVRKSNKKLPSNNTESVGTEPPPSSVAADDDYSSFKYWRHSFEKLFDDRLSSSTNGDTKTLDNSNNNNNNNSCGDSSSSESLKKFMERRFKMDGGGKVTIDASPTKKMSTASEPITIPNVGAARMTFPRNSAKDAFDTTQTHTQLSPNASTEPPRRFFEHQDIIPQALLDNFISMVEPSRAQLIETDISRHCAHNFPAVAFTLGRKNWPQIKNTYVTLANDMQWRVRQTLAFSIHEMAAILGEEYTTTDLLPVFQGFLKDLDEVRIGVLNHLYQFLKILSPTTRKVLLKVLADFLQTDNVKNWRFRYEFTRQCIFLCELYEIDDVNDYIAAIGLTLATDRIADIRREASVLLATILGRFVDAEESMLIEHNPQMMTTTQSFVDDIVKGFALSVRWLRRQTYAIFCEKVLERRIMREQIFANLLLTPLLGLANDRIPNVRYAFVRAIAVCGLDYYTDERLTLVVDTLKRIMTTDEDFDCRNLARQALGIQYEDLVYYADAKPAAAAAALSIDVDNCAPPPGSTTTDQHQSTTTPENTIIDTC